MLRQIIFFIPFLIGMLFAGALSTLLIREIAILIKKNDIDRIFSKIKQNNNY